KMKKRNVIVKETKIKLRFIITFLHKININTTKKKIKVKALKIAFSLRRKRTLNPISFSFFGIKNNRAINPFIKMVNPIISGVKFLFFIEEFDCIKSFLF